MASHRAGNEPNRGRQPIIQINIDHGGVAAPLHELIPTLRRVQAARRPLLLWGEFTPDDWQLIQRELSPAGLSLQPIVRDGQEQPGGMFPLGADRVPSLHRWHGSVDKHGNKESL